MKVLVCDPIAKRGVEVLRQTPGLTVEERHGLKGADLLAAVADVEAIAVRSETKITREVLAAAKKLRVVGRAGVGVDNVDVEAATERGVIVMNTPGGNTISTAEHTISMMMAVSRNIPQACATLKGGKWDRKSFQGTQLNGKTLGIVGLGRIGMAVARRALGLKMKVIGYDPIAIPESAAQIGIEMVADLKEVCKRCDYLTLHVPVTDQTRGMINAELLGLMKPTARIINVARGPVINEDDLYAALAQKKIAGAALDVFAKEPPENRGFEKLENCIVTPHLGASTDEAQVEVALDAAQELVEALRGTQVRNAVNVPGLDKTLPEIVRKYRVLAERLGMVISSITPGVIKKVEVSYRGEIATVDTAAVTTSFSIGLLKKHFEEPLNIVNVPVLAKQRGISIDEVKNPAPEDFSSVMSARLVTDQADRKVTGTIIGQNIPRIISIDDFSLEMSPEGPIMIIFNNDRPGVIGAVGTICGKHKINIGTMGVGRVKDQNRAILAISMDAAPDQKAIEEFKKQDFVKQVYVCELPDGSH